MGEDLESVALALNSLSWSTSGETILTLWQWTYSHSFLRNTQSEGRGQGSSTDYCVKLERYCFTLFIDQHIFLFECVGMLMTLNWCLLMRTDLLTWQFAYTCLTWNLLYTGPMLKSGKLQRCFQLTPHFQCLHNWFR